MTTCLGTLTYTDMQNVHYLVLHQLVNIFFCIKPADYQQIS